MHKPFLNPTLGAVAPAQPPQFKGGISSTFLPAWVLKPNPFLPITQAHLGTEQSHSGGETALCDALQSIIST